MSLKASIAPLKVISSARRKTDNVTSMILLLAIVIMIVGYLHAQSLPTADLNVIVAVNSEQIRSVMERVNKLETSQQYGLGALIANLAAHLWQIRRQARH